VADALDHFTIVHKNATKTFMARVLDWDGSVIAQVDISTVTYAIYVLTDQAPDTRTAVTGHAGSLTVSDVIFNTLQTDDRWTEDDTGYNFRHTPIISANEAFATAGKNYLVEYILTPVTGQKILIRFRPEAI